MSLVPDNLLFGMNDDIPGVAPSGRLPTKSEDVSVGRGLKYAQMKTIYVHNIRIASMNEVDLAFSQFLKDWRKHAQFSSKETVAIDHQAQILERKLVVAPHNSWRVIGSG